MGRCDVGTLIRKVQVLHPQSTVVPFVGLVHALPAIAAPFERGCLNLCISASRGCAESSTARLDLKKRRLRSPFVR